MAKKKPKVLIIGWARSGKDTAAAVISELWNLKFTSSSVFAAKKILPALNTYMVRKGFSEYPDEFHAFNDRQNHRALWRDLIHEYNSPLNRLATEILEDNDMYVGMRDIEEFEASRHMFDIIIWIDAEGRIDPEPTSSCTVTKELATVTIENKGTEAEFIDKLREFCEGE